MTEPRRRLATIMFSDMVGYSALAQRNEALAVELLEEHRRLLRGLFSQYGGREVDAVGDGFFVEFPSAVDATRCAVAIQQALTDRNATADVERRIQVRIGLHLGDVLVEGDRVMGDGVNIAARIESATEPGGICVSEDVARQIQNKIELPLDRLGPGELKNIKLPIQIYRVRLPWDNKRKAFRARLGFRMRQARVRAMALAVIVMLAGVGATLLYTHHFSSTHQGREDTPRLAVLPFANLSADPANEYFADGMTEELISRLSRITGVEVIARTSVMQYKGKTRSIGDIGRELNVDSVLEGSVRKAGDKVRITAQLIKVQTQGHIWSEDYDREAKDLFAIQADVARQVASALQLRLGHSDRQQIEKKGTDNLQAYELYLQGVYQQNKATREGLESSLQYFNRAIELDPHYARAYAAAAFTYELQGEFYFAPQGVAFQKARASALRALQLDDSVVDAHLVSGIMKTYLELDWKGALQSYQRALTLNPNSALAEDDYAVLYLAPLGHYDEAIARMKRALELDPLSPLYQMDLGFVYFYTRRYNEAIDQFTGALEREPGMSQARWGRALAYAGKGAYSEATADFEELIKADAGRTRCLAYLVWINNRTGRKDQAREIFEQLKATDVSLVSLAVAHIGMGEKDAALELLQKSYEKHDYYRLMWLKTGFLWDPLRSDPRFIGLLKKVGLQD